MKTYSFTMGIALVLLLLTLAHSHAAKSRPVSYTFSATFTDGVETNIDTNGDNVSAGVVQGILNSNIGRFFTTAEPEYVGPSATNTTCPQGTAEFHTVQDHAVFTEEKTSDQLFAAATVTLCLNQTSPDLPFSYTGNATYIGGTGKFAGATGTFNFQGKGKYLVFGLKGGVFGGFGQINETGTGTITLPKGEEIQH